MPWKRRIAADGAVGGCEDGFEDAVAVGDGDCFGWRGFVAGFGWRTQNGVSWRGNEGSIACLNEAPGDRDEDAEALRGEKCHKRERF